MHVFSLGIAAGLLWASVLASTPGHAAQPEMRQDPGFGRPPAVPSPGAPLGAKAVPARGLTDAELYRLLLVLSAQTRPAMGALAGCYPLGRPGWRDCVTQR